MQKKKEKKKGKKKYISPYQVSEIINLSINKAEHKAISKLYMFICKLRREFGLGLGFGVGHFLVGVFWGGELFFGLFVFSPV